MEKETISNRRKISHVENALMRSTYGRRWPVVKRELRKSPGGNVVLACRARMCQYIEQQTETED